MELFVDHADWNDQYKSPEQYVKDLAEYDDEIEGKEFQLVRVEVSAATRYRIENGKPVAISVSFPMEESLDG